MDFQLLFFFYYECAQNRCYNVFSTDIETIRASNTKREREKESKKEKKPFVCENRSKCHFQNSKITISYQVKEK